MAELIAMLAKMGIEAGIELIQTWKKAGEPTPEEIRAAYIEKRPGDYFTNTTT